VRGNLPAEFSSFVGRREELSEVRGSLTASRLVTLTGVGGVGKTRLALRVAASLHRSVRDGVWLVELAGLRDAALVPQAVCDALRIPDQTVRDQVTVLAEFLADRDLLLVVDNCEHLLPECASVIATLLRAAPRLRVLATSREVLGIPGERVCQVAPLPVPEPTGSGFTVGPPYPGVVLFVERAVAVCPDFVLNADNAALVNRVCYRLEGLPLAIELAAARVRSLSLAHVAEQLDDRFRLLTAGNRIALPRQQTLRAAVSWSFDLCTEAERSLWLHASVFAGWFEVAALASVCGGAVGDVSTVLAGLVDKSVIIHARDDRARSRYGMLDTLRAYGLERLREPDRPTVTAVPDEATLRRRHRDYYLELAERFRADWFGPRQAQWTTRMRAERAELRTALGCCFDDALQGRAGVALAGSLYDFWWGCGEVREGRLGLERALAADPVPSRERMRGLAAYSRVLLVQGLPAAVAEPAREGQALARRFDEPFYLVDTLQTLGQSTLYCGDPTAGLSLLEEAVVLAGDLGADQPASAQAALMLATVVLFDDDPARAGDLLAHSRGICQARGDQWWLGMVLNVSVMLALRLGDVDQAEADGREALRVRRGLHDPVGSGGALELLSWTAAAAGQYRRAARLLGAAERQWRMIGGSPFSAGRWLAEHQAREAEIRHALGAAFDVEFGHGGELDLHETTSYALGEPPVPAQVPAPPAPPRLTRREQEVTELIALGMSNREIATRLVISRRTAEYHVEKILTKLGFTTRTQIAAWYRHADRR
jgi:predicted ATPase/DNA-binding CsgD family transcriptional regulator